MILIITLIMIATTSRFKKVFHASGKYMERSQYRQCAGYQPYYAADFSPVWDATLKYEGGYEAQATDPGAWTGGQVNSGSLIGSKYGISAPTLTRYLGRTATTADMQNLTKQQSEDIAKQYYWNPIQGDSIQNEGVAHAIFDTVWASGGSGAKIVRQAINDTAGSNVVDANSRSMSLSSAELAQVNSLPAQTLFDKILSLRNAFDQSLKSAAIYGKGWANRINSILKTYAGSFVGLVKRHKVVAAGFVIVTLVAIVIGISVITIESK